MAGEDTLISKKFHLNMDFNKNSRIFIACPNRTADILAREVSDLGYSVIRIYKTGVELNGSLNDCIRLNLNLRCATQVRYSLCAFRASRPEDVYREAMKFPWEEVIPTGEMFSVSNSTEHFTVNNTMFMNVVIKDAVVDRFREKIGTRPDSGKELAGVCLHLYWREDNAEIFLDTSGEVISRHGYRRIPGKAPMQESLAAALILSSAWDRKSPFVNPMCGSGTLAIEAALIATGRRPGLIHRDYAFCHLLGYESASLEAFREELKGQIISPGEHLRILATDIKPNAVEDARENARAAGVEELLEFDCCDYQDSSIPEAPGVIILNPEYGLRLGDLEELKKTYGEIGDFFKKKCGGYIGYVFTGNLELAKAIGLKPKRRIEFYSATLDCRLLEYELYSGSRRSVVTNTTPES